MWMMLLRPGVYAGNSISNSIKERSEAKRQKLHAEMMKAAERLSDEINAEAKHRGFEISDFEGTNVMAFYLKDYALLDALSRYLTLVKNGDRFPASEEVCWRYGYELRKARGKLNNEDRRRMSRILAKERQEARAANKGKILGFVAAAALSFAISYLLRQSPHASYQQLRFILLFSGSLFGLGAIWLLAGK